MKQKRRKSRSLTVEKKRWKFSACLLSSYILEKSWSNWNNFEIFTIWDLCLATDHLETVGLLKTTTIISYRESYTESKLESIYVAHEWGIEVKFLDTCIRVDKTKRHFGKLANDPIYWTFQMTEFESTFLIASLILWMRNCKSELKECIVHGVSEKNCAKLFMSELRQISINFNNVW